MFLGSTWYGKDYEVDSVGLDAIILVGIFLMFVASLVSYCSVSPPSAHTG